MKTKSLEQEVEKLRRWEDAYYNGAPVVPDATYDVERDRVVALLEATDPENAYLDEVGSAVPRNSVWDKFTHTAVMGSLFKVNNETDLRKWSKGKGTNFFLSEKADGCTIVAYYEDGKLATLATRGDGMVGEDITANARYFQNVKLRVSDTFTGILRGEGMLHLDTFKQHFAPLGTSNPRNGASGKARDTKNPHLKRHIVVKWFDIIAEDDDFQTWEDKFEFIKSLGLETIPYYPNLSIDDVWKTYNKYVNGRRSSLNYWIDGLVARISNLDAHDAFGVTDKRPKGSRAIKFPAVGVETVLENVETENRGKGGRFAPVGLIKPVRIDGSTITRVSMHGPDWIEAMNVAIGDTVEVAKAGDIIPQIIKVVKRPATRQPIVFPAHCPICTVKLVRNGAYIECQNKSCEGEVAGALAKWLNKTGIKGIGDSILQELIVDVKDIADLYEADSSVFAKAAKGSDKTGKKIYRVVQASREMPLAIFLSALHIDSLGSTNGQRVAAHFKTLDKVLAASETDLREVEGISENASKIRAGLTRKEALIRKLDQLLDIQEVHIGALSGLSFCITGKMQSGKKRPAIEGWVKEQGGLIKGVDKNLSYLVTDTPDSGSSKNKKADKYGVKKITEEELYKLDVLKKDLPAVPQDNVISLKKKKITVTQSSGLSLFDSFGQAQGWLEVTENGTKFRIVGNNISKNGDPLKNKTRLGFSSWDASVKDLDDGASLQSQKLKISSHLKYEGVEIREKMITAPSFEEVKKALKLVTFSSWSEGDL
jgi:DNA ligase (NAD+)